MLFLGVKQSYAAPSLLHGPKDLLDLAKANSSNYLVSLSKLEVSKLELKNNFANFLPELDLSTSQGYAGQKSDPDSSDTDDWTSSLELSLSEKLYDNGTNFIKYNEAKKNLILSQLEHEDTTAKLGLEIVKLYLAHMLNLKILEIQEDQHKLIVVQFERIKRQYRQGMKTRIDYVRFKARLKRSSLALSKLKLDCQKSLLEIFKSVGKDSEGFSLMPLKIAELDLETLPDHPSKLETHYSYKKSLIQKEINNYKVDIERKKDGPVVKLTSAVNYINNEYLAGTDSFTNDYNTSWKIQLGVNFNLLDWGVRSRNVVIAKKEKRQSEHLIDQEIRNLKTGLENNYADIIQSKESYLLNKELVGLEKKNYEAIDGKYKNGRVAFLDLINSLTDYSNARESHLRNHFKLQELMASYQYHNGKIYEFIENF